MGINLFLRKKFGLIRQIQIDVLVKTMFVGDFRA